MAWKEFNIKIQTTKKKNHQQLDNRIPLLTHVCACINAPPQPLQLASYCQRLGPMYLQYSSRQWIQGILGIQGWWVWWRYVALRYMVLLGSVQRESCVKPQIFKLERWLKYLQGSQIGDSKQILSHEREDWTKTLRNSEKQMCHSVPWPTLVHGRFHLK